MLTLVWVILVHWEKKPKELLLLNYIETTCRMLQPTSTEANKALPLRYI